MSFFIKLSLFPNSFLSLESESFTTCSLSAIKNSRSPSSASSLSATDFNVFSGKNFAMGESKPLPEADLIFIHASPFAPNVLTFSVRSSSSFLE